ncbi:hypothetical protein HPB52_015341 [Rhipicephalus sanguineus]|uniref:HTH myb-type domain-containing protein n=1 Tax=Rhipicephalus sanguineus TaxID=34632 RepID=A0A9D4PL43_RHISA|nr:hypothetical protein HPB52_015341 [Rhipicephalus sanguineus]
MCLRLYHKMLRLLQRNHAPRNLQMQGRLLNKAISQYAQPLHRPMVPNLAAYERQEWHAVANVLHDLHGLVRPPPNTEVEEVGTVPVIEEFFSKEVLGVPDAFQPNCGGLVLPLLPPSETTVATFGRLSDRFASGSVTESLSALQDGNSFPELSAALDADSIEDIHCTVCASRNLLELSSVAARASQDSCSRCNELRATRKKYEVLQARFISYFFWPAVLDTMNVAETVELPAETHKKRVKKYYKLTKIKKPWVKEKWKERKRLIAAAAAAVAGAAAEGVDAPEEDGNEGPSGTSIRVYLSALAVSRTETSPREVHLNAIVTPMTKEKSATTNSTYSSGLCDADRERYAQKLELCGFDPFELDARKWLVSADVWPRVNMCDIHDFLVVNHSQNLSIPPVKASVCAKSDGEVLAAHCVCMAGNGEACSHDAALLFCIEYGVRAREERSCTDSCNAWLPAHVRKIEARPVAEIEFSSATMKKRRLDENLQTSPNVPARRPAPPPTDDEWSEFFGAVTASGLRPAVLSANPKYSSLYMPAVAHFMRTRSKKQLMRRYYRSMDPSLQHGPWTAPEDVASMLPGRTSNQCRERYKNTLTQRCASGPYTPNEDYTLLELVQKHGVGHWTKVSTQESSTICYK